jgi:hypothetical protein
MSDLHDDTGRPSIPDEPELLTPEWLTEALRHAGHDVTVTDVRRTQVGTGQMGTSIRLEMTFEGDRGELPPTLVAKLPAPDPQQRAMVAGIYRTEVEFYRQLAPTLAVRTPTCHYADLAPQWTEFVLLLEDLAPKEQGDQIRGCTVDEARVGVVNLAGLHGPRWGDPTLTDHEWMQIIAGDGATMIGLIMRDATDRFIERYGDRLGDEDKELLGRIPELLPEWILARPERVAPIHGDYRLDNLLFGQGEDPVATVDWQTITLGLPARDLAYFLSTGLRTVERRAHEDELIEEYHRALVAHGVTGHSLEECRDDYRFSMLQGPLITIVGAAYGAPTERGDEMFLAMATRSAQAIRDHGTLEMLG